MGNGKRNEDDRSHSSSFLAILSTTYSHARTRNSSARQQILNQNPSFHYNHSSSSSPPRHSISSLEFAASLQHDQRSVTKRKNKKKNHIYRARARPPNRFGSSAPNFKSFNRTKPNRLAQSDLKYDRLSCLLSFLCLIPNFSSL